MSHNSTTTQTAAFFVACLQNASAHVFLSTHSTTHTQLHIERKSGRHSKREISPLLLSLSVCLCLSWVMITIHIIGSNNNNSSTHTMENSNESNNQKRNEATLIPQQTTTTTFFIFNKTRNQHSNIFSKLSFQFHFTRNACFSQNHLLRHQHLLVQTVCLCFSFFCVRSLDLSVKFQWRMGRLAMFRSIACCW